MTPRKPVIFLKAHVSGYTRQDGRFVAAHEDRRPSAHVAHADPVWDPAKAKVEIARHMDEDEDYADFGLRIIPDGHDASAGSVLPVSKRWDDGSDTGEELNGTSTIGIAKISDIDRAIALLMDAGYQGSQVALVKGEKTQSGEDPGEALINEATVVTTWRLPKIRKSHPVSAGWTPPTEAQATTGNYKKPRMRWRGMEIAVECPAGTVRSGRDRNGQEWSIRMLYPYGYLVGTMGVDGDPVDCYVGPDADAPMVYLVTTRVPGKWDTDDEQKAMIGFASEEDARAAFLKHYNDPRFLGSVLAMPADEFVRKVRATAQAPAMIKAVVFFRRPR